MWSRSTDGTSIAPTVTSPGAGLGEGRGVDFFSLPRAVQERFLMAAGGGGAPELLAFRAHGLRANWALIAGSAACFVAIFVFASLGFGSLRHPLGLQPVLTSAVYLVLGAVGVLLLLRALRARSAASALPYALGDYLFEGCIVTARVGSLRCTLLPSTGGVSAQRQSVTVHVADRSFVFPLSKGLEPQEVADRLQKNATLYAKAVSSLDVRALALLNPLQDSGFANPLSPKSSLPPPPRQSRVYQGLAVVLTCGAALGVFIVRNDLSERELYRAAFEENTVEGYQSYLAQGGGRRTVSELLLPRAELAAARGSARAVGNYLRAHPHVAIRSEVEKALREELLRELTNVKAQDSLTALVKFREHYPQHPLVQDELESARGEVFDRALERFKAATVGKKELQTLVATLLKYTKQHGPTVHVRYRRFFPPSVARIERQVRRSKYFVGERSLPTRYFTD